MGFGLQQNVQVHTSADHLGRSFHQAAVKESMGVNMSSKLKF